MLPISFKSSINNKLKDRELLNKTKSERKKVNLSKNNIIDVIELIRQDIEKHLGQYKNQYRCITTIEDFKDYIDKANAYGKIAIDTETTGLDPLRDKIVGLCLYFPGEKAVYVPINHIDYFTGERIQSQLTEEEIAPILKNLTAKIIMHNAPFDLRIIKHNFNIIFHCWWETQVAATLLNENESHALKYLHGKYISHTVEKTFDEFFGKNTITDIPIEYAYLYAAHDAVDTFDLYEFQSQFLTDNTDRQDRKDLYWLYRNIEIPMIDVIISLEDTGIYVDIDYLDSLKEKYHKLLDDALNDCYKEIDTTYKDVIEQYNTTHPENALTLPININSSKQLAILFYDILKAKPIANKKPRSTDVDVMQIWENKYPIAKSILNYRAASKITSTYVDNIYNILFTDGRVHTHFNSNGAVTGRMSSKDPLNLQNIPSRNSEIRKMFVGQTSNRNVEQRSDGAFIFNRCEEVETNNGWKFVEQLVPGDILIDDQNNNLVVKIVKVKDLKVLVGVN